MKELDVPDDSMIQIAPFPHELAALVKDCKLWPNWRIKLYGNYPRDLDANENAIGRGLTLSILAETINSYNHDETDYTVQHLFIVPAATWNRQNWQDWLFDRFCDVQKHEAMEIFMIGDERPYAPNHGAGENPYTVRLLNTAEAASTGFADHYRKVDHE